MSSRATANQVPICVVLRCWAQRSLYPNEDDHELYWNRREALAQDIDFDAQALRHLPVKSSVQALPSWTNDTVILSVFLKRVYMLV